MTPDELEEEYPELDLEDFEVEVPTPEEVFQTIDWSNDDMECWLEAGQ